MKKLSINNFTTKLLSNLEMDPYIKINKKFTKKIGSKVINRPYFHRKTGLQCRSETIYEYCQLNFT